ncbi:MAG TPA: hypothetical protein VIA18_33105 [Polyangia bacterium]|nr:hypothetical protein [Polyangia bacterium]
MQQRGCRTACGEHADEPLKRYRLFRNGAQTAALQILLVMLCAHSGRLHHRQHDARWALRLVEAQQLFDLRDAFAIGLVVLVAFANRGGTRDGVERRQNENAGHDPVNGLGVAELEYRTGGRNQRAIEDEVVLCPIPIELYLKAILGQRQLVLLL